MEYFTTTSKASNRSADCIIVGIYDRGKLGEAAADVDKASGGELQKRYKRGDLGTNVGDAVVLGNLPGVRADRVVVVGLGKAAKFDLVAFRKAVNAATNA